MKTVFKIGEVAAMFEISIRALRLYDSIGLFQPEYKDVNTGYRYYTAEQMQKLDVLISLKKVGCKLSQIKTLFDHGINEDDIRILLQREELYWEDQIEIAQHNIEKITDLKNALAIESDILTKNHLTDEQKAFKLSRLICLENRKLEADYSELLWL